MKNRLITLLILILTLFVPLTLISGQASAVDIFKNSCSGQASSSGVCHDVSAQQSSGTDPIITLIKDVISVVSYVVGAAAIIGILLSGFRFITASGDPQSIATARNGLIYSLIGVAVAILSQVIVIFVLDKVS